MLAVHHLAVKASDLARSRVFYVEVLGLPVLKTHEDALGVRSFWRQLGAGEAFLALERADKKEDLLRHDDAVGWHCVALSMSVDARAAWIAKLEAAGHPVFRQTPYSIYVRDPDGVVIALSHYPHEAR